MPNTQPSRIKSLIRKYTRLELASSAKMSTTNTTTEQSVQPDMCPVNLKSKGYSGRIPSNKLQKPLRQHPLYQDPPASPKYYKPNTKAPAGKPLSASLKARIREGPVGKSLGRLAVEHDLVSYPHGDALLGIPEDERHSRWSYMMIANEAIDHARLHLDKGERPTYTHPGDARTQTAPAAICGPETPEAFEEKRSRVELVNISAPAELETRDDHQHLGGSVELPATVCRPASLRPGKKHPLCEKFEQSTNATGKAKDPHELHFNQPRPLPNKPTNFSKPLPSVLQIRSDRTRGRHELNGGTGDRFISRHPTTLRAGARQSMSTGGQIIEQGCKSDPGFALIDNREGVDLINFTAPPAISTETEDVRNIKMLISRMPSIRENNEVSPRSEAKRKSRQHRGTVIVTCDADKANGVTDDSFAEGIAALKELGRTQAQSRENGYASNCPSSVTFNQSSSSLEYDAESPIIATAAVALPGRANLTEVGNSSRSNAVELEAHASKQHKLASEQAKQSSLSSAWFATGQTMIPDEHAHPHPLRSNPTASLPSRSLKSVRRVTRDPANQGVAFGVHQFRDVDPAAVYRGSDEYRLRRAARRKEAKKVSDAIEGAEREGEGQRL